MCTTCGCGHGETRIDNVPAGARASPGHEHTAMHAHGDAHDHGHGHADGTWHRHDADAHRAIAGGAFGAVHAAGTSPERIVQIERDILSRNNALAAANRRAFEDRGVFALNLVSSPGSGKTTLLVKTIEALQGRLPVAVIEGDQQTSLDADRIRATGAAAVQINTGKGCHLDAQMVGQALRSLEITDDSVLLIENVGNLVCPAAFDLGEAHKVVILSVTEGDDKPLKYPDMFHAADLLIVNKIDLLPYVAFDVHQAIEYARRVRPGLEVLCVSATTGENFQAWLAWLERGALRERARRDEAVDALHRRIAALEDELARRTAAV
ncbi:MAG: hydrogenase nickel incorporation protein HypB [Casimicrobiaceae bacterium]